MAADKKPNHVEDKRLIFAHKNLQRWSLYSTDPWMSQRVLERYGPDGKVIERCVIGSWEMPNGQARTLGIEEGAMMNLIEAMHFKYRPRNGVLRVPTSEFYDFVVDIASLRDPSRRKRRDSVNHRNYVYDRLYLLTAISIMFDNWKEKDGEGGAQRFNLIDDFQIYGKTAKGKWGEIEITINPVVAAGLRDKHTAPILIEVANSFKTDYAWQLYRYLDKVLSKCRKFEISLDDYAKRMVIRDRKDVLISKIRVAVNEVENKDITSGRVTVCKIEKRGKLWWIVAERGRRLAVKSNLPEIDRRENETFRAQFDDYLERYKVMPDAERGPLEAEIERRLAANRWGKPGNNGYEILRNAVIVEVVEAHLMAKINQVSSEFCAPSAPRPLVLREGPCLNPYKGAAQIRHETEQFLGLPFRLLLPYRKDA